MWKTGINILFNTFGFDAIIQNRLIIILSFLIIKSYIPNNQTSLYFCDQSSINIDCGNAYNRIWCHEIGIWNNKHL